MNNADMPAMPGDLHPSDAGMLPEFRDGVNAADLTRWNCGLTKREYFAGLALQGIAADPDFSGDAEDAATIACDYADELLAKLGSTK